MIHMALHGREHPVPLSSIASLQDISQHYLEQLFMKLRKSKLVKSVRGPAGGYILARPLDKISVGDIFRAVDESMSLLSCVEIKQKDKTLCNKIDKCVSRVLWKRLTENISKAFDSISLQNLCQEQEEMNQCSKTPLLDSCKNRDK